MGTENKPPTIVRLAVANGALLEVPVWEQHGRGSNWAAVVDVDGTAPAGLSRRWLPRGRGACWYGVVVAKTEDFLLLEEAESGAKAVLRAREKRGSDLARETALRIERQQLLDRAAKIEAEIVDMNAPEEAPRAD